MKTSLFQILDNEDSNLDVENISSKLTDCIKQIELIALLFNLLLYFIVPALIYLPVMLLFII